MEDIKSTSKFFEFLAKDLDSVKQTIEPDTLKLVQGKLIALQDADDDDDDLIITLSNEILDLGLHSSASDVFHSLNERVLLYQGKGSKSDLLKPTRLEKTSTYGRQMDIPAISDTVKVKSLATYLSENVKTMIGEGVEVAAEGQPAQEVRYANVGLFADDDPENPTVCSIKEPLANDKEYYLRINIGQPMDWDCGDEKDRPEFVPGDILPQTDINGHWLDVIASASKGDFVIANGHQSLFLPLSGESWTCTCAHAQKHTCTEQERQRFIYITVRTSKNIGDLQLEIGFYFENNLLQNRIFTAHVGSPLTKTEPAYRSHTSFTLTHTLSNVAEIYQPVALNARIRKSEDGSHQVFLVGGKGTQDNDRLIHFSELNDAALGKILYYAREILWDRYLKKERKVFTGIKNGNKDAKYDFVEDLRELAKVGNDLYVQIFKSYTLSREKLKRIFTEENPQHVIQICVEEQDDSSTPYPWSLIYDIPLDSDKTRWNLCELLKEENWQTFQQTAPHHSARCPFEKDGNHAKNMICPFGFWGFRYIITQPPSIPEHRAQLPVKINISNKPMRMVASFHKDTAEWIDEMQGLVEQAKISLDVAGDTRDAFLEELKGNSELVYLMCHGRDQSLGEELSDPYLEIGKGEMLTTNDLLFWRDDVHSSIPDHWQTTSPLVFINGCHTAELTPQDRARFVDGFMEANASGVIGTEMPVYDDFANKAALLFFSHFIMEKQTVGQALREMRMDLLAEGNLFGLGYSAYCLSNLQLEGQ